MSIDTSLRRELITRIVQIADQQLDAGEAKQFRLFLEQVIHVHPEENLFKQSDESCFGAFYGLYQFGLERQSEETKVHIFNPDCEKDGWNSERTVIYFCQRDVPFLVDSLKSGAQDDLSVFTVTMRELKGLVDATFSSEDD